MIDINKTYCTKDGRPVIIYTTERKTTSSFCVVGAVAQSDGEHSVLFWTEKGTSNHSSKYDLVEYNPANDLKLDQPIWVRVKGSQVWLPRHFAGFRDGIVYAWYDGTTSHTARSVHHTNGWPEWTAENPYNQSVQ